MVPRVYVPDAIEPFCRAQQRLADTQIHIPRYFVCSNRPHSSAMHVMRPNKTVEKLRIVCDHAVWSKWRENGQKTVWQDTLFLYISLFLLTTTLEIKNGDGGGRLQPVQLPMTLQLLLQTQQMLVTLRGCGCRLLLCQQRSQATAVAQNTVLQFKRGKIKIRFSWEFRALCKQTFADILLPRYS